MIYNGTLYSENEKYDYKKTALEYYCNFIKRMWQFFMNNFNTSEELKSGKEPARVLDLFMAAVEYELGKFDFGKTEKFEDSQKELASLIAEIEKVFDKFSKIDDKNVVELLTDFIKKIKKEIVYSWFLFENFLKFLKLVINIKNTENADIFKILKFLLEEIRKRFDDKNEIKEIIIEGNLKMNMFFQINRRYVNKK